ncbi:type I restriction-modification system subunit M [Butyrivibrio sp. NC2002]|uniref:type I restriction-modification system subunit M n=1 Tax=Butyrivibrio sp. NC2002 TaxID=1410610 RepID=UPI00055A4C4F|nr:type I restriction-modification system subunit M [Butyrivibrio sp. NC2002]
MAINTDRAQAQAAELSSQLWSIADDLRGGMDANEFRNYILGTIFYRYLSERTELYMQDILKNDNLTYEQAFNDADYKEVVEDWSLEHLGYIIKPENLFRELNRKIVKPTNDGEKFSIEDYERAVSELTGSTLGHKSEAAFSGLFDDMRLQDTRLGDTVSERTDKIGKVIAKIGEIDMDLQDQEFDVLGTAYMILIGLFQSGAGKKGGEFFTPVGPSTLCATLATIGLDEAKTVGDCTCGSGSMLLDVRKHLTTGRVGHFYGQENNPTTFNLARMNMLMHGVDYQNFSLYKGDTLTNDMYGDDLKLTVQVCNPPYSLKWDAKSEYLDDPRYSGVNKLAPKSHADFAFVQHMVYHMDEADGRVAVLLPHGVLFRGGAEEDIRKWLISTVNRLDAVIGLPANLFHGTSIPVVILVLKSKRNGNSDNILFIDASKEFIKGKNQNELPDESIKKIVDAYVARTDIPQYAYVADIQTEIIDKNGYNLNIPRYIDTSEEEQEIDIAHIKHELEDIQKQKDELQNTIIDTMKLLGL